MDKERECLWYLGNYGTLGRRPRRGA